MANFQTILTTQFCLKLLSLHLYQSPFNDGWYGRKKISPLSRRTKGRPERPERSSFWLPETNLLPLKNGGKAGRRMFFRCRVEQQPISRGEVLVVGEGSIILMTFYDES